MCVCVCVCVCVVTGILMRPGANMDEAVVISLCVFVQGCGRKVVSWCSWVWTMQARPRYCTCSETTDLDNTSQPSIPVSLTLIALPTYSKTYSTSNRHGSVTGFNIISRPEVAMFCKVPHKLIYNHSNQYYAR